MDADLDTLKSGRPRALAPTRGPSRATNWSSIGPCSEILARPISTGRRPQQPAPATSPKNALVQHLPRRSVAAARYRKRRACLRLPPPAVVQTFVHSHALV